MSHIFISYSHDDSEYVLKLVAALEQKGFSAWIDERIDYGTQWPRVIQEHIDGCGSFVVIMSPRSYGSDWVQNELSYAMGEGKPIFPLLLEGKAWLSVSAIQYVDVRSGKLPPKDFYSRLKDVIQPSEQIPIERISRSRDRPSTIVDTPDTLKITAPIHLELIRIPAGEFLMGSDPKNDENARDNEQPQHSVYVAEYYIGKYPVTQLQYKAFVDENKNLSSMGFYYADDKKDHPVVNVSWKDAKDYCKWLSKKIGKSYRLPTEAEWEKAARGTDGRIYPWGNEWDKTKCNSSERGIYETSPVGQYSPQGDSPYGCADMAGNIWEWCSTRYERYPYKIDDGQEEMSSVNVRLLRGGSFGYDRGDARCAYRYKYPPDLHRRQNGFRIVLSLSDSKL